MGRISRPVRSSGISFVTVLMVLIALILGGVLLSNQDGVNGIATEVDRTERDLVDLSEGIAELSELKQRRTLDPVEHERMARERLHWTKAGEYLIKVQEP